MIIGIGTDIVQVSRIQQSLDRLGDAFARRVLTDSELATFKISRQPAAFLAKRFAAKEAAAKALGTGIGKVAFQHLEVSNDALGAPKLKFYGYARELQLLKAINHLHLSLSDEKDNAVAFVVLEAA